MDVFMAVCAEEYEVVVRGRTVRDYVVDFMLDVVWSIWADSAALISGYDSLSGRFIYPLFLEGIVTDGDIINDSPKGLCI